MLTLPTIPVQGLRPFEPAPIVKRGDASKPVRVRIAQPTFPTPSTATPRLAPSVTAMWCHAPSHNANVAAQSFEFPENDTVPAGALVAMENMLRVALVLVEPNATAFAAE